MGARNARRSAKVKQVPKNAKPSHNQSRAKWFAEELFKHEVFTYIGKAIHWLIANYTFAFSFIVSAYTWLLQFGESGSTYALIQYLEKYPVRVSIAAIVVAMFSPAIKGLITSAYMWLRGKLPSGHADIEQESSEEELLVQAVGISGFYPHTSKKEKRDDWKTCVARIRGHRAKDLRIMGATGWATFGAPESPLYKLLDEFDGEIKVLLMKADPSLSALVQRAKETGYKPDDYALEIRRSIDRLRQLKGKGKNISLKCYTQMPVWKMLISNDYMWLQHYRNSRNVDDTPVYVFYSDGDEGTSLFHALYSVWLKRWEVDGNEVIDLSAA